MIFSLIHSINFQGKAFDVGGFTLDFRGSNMGAPGRWTTVADTGSTLSLMTLILMALGVAARQFKWAAADRNRLHDALPPFN